MNAEKYGLDKIYFGGCFIRGWHHFPCCVVIVSHVYQAMQRLSARYRTQYDFGAKARSAPYSSDTKDFCAYLSFLNYFVLTSSI